MCILNIIKFVFLTLSDSRFDWNHVFKCSNSSFIIFTTGCRSLCWKKIFVSSANSIKWSLLVALVMSLIYKSIEVVQVLSPAALLYLSLNFIYLFIYTYLDCTPQKSTYCCLFSKYDVNHCKAIPLTP